jgi:hypothetical protein
VTWPWRWPWPWRRHTATTDEVHTVLEQLQQRDAEVQGLSKELRAAQRQNHFSIAVHDAIRRTRET